MRLRLRPGRPDIRQVFSDPGAPGTYTSSGSGVDASRRPQRMLSPGRPRPKQPPPPPPPPSSTPIPENEQSLPELPPRQIFPFTKKQIEQMNQQARQFSVKSNSKQKIVSSFPRVNEKMFDSEASASSNIRPVSWSPLATSTPPCTGDTVEDVTKKKEHRHSDPGPVIPKLVVHVENSPEGQTPVAKTYAESKTKTFHLQEAARQHPEDPPGNLTSRIGDLNEDKICTIVTVSTPGTPSADVHRLQIKGEHLVTDMNSGPKKRTSIRINSDDSTEDIKRLGFIPVGNSSVTSLVVQEDALTTSSVKKDSSNKVTISVGGAEVKNRNTDNRILSSLCTVIDTSPCSTLNSNNIYKGSSCSSLTVLSSNQVNVIPVSPDHQVQRTLLVVDDHDNGERSRDTMLRCWNGDSPTSSSSDSDITVTVGGSVEENVQHVQKSDSNVILQPRSRGIDFSSTLSVSDDIDILLNPVEAVKRNLVPHVCGRKILAPGGESVDKTSSPTVRLDKLIELQEDINDNEREALKEGDYFISAAASKLMDLTTNEDSPLYSNVSATVSRSSEDTLPTVIEQEEEDDVFQTESFSSNKAHGRLKPFDGLDTEECKAEDKSISGESSGFDTAPSSIEPENGGVALPEDGSDSVSHSQLSICLPAKDSDDPVTEKDDKKVEVELRVKTESCDESNSEADDENIYEIIKDPIYEEIPDTPPPLPMSPPPSLDDLEESKRGSRSIFEGASKYDILNYLVGAKERGIVPEEMYYSGSVNGDEVVGIIDGKQIQDEDGGGQSHKRMTSLDLGDLSSRVSHLSNASDSSEDSCNLTISNIGDVPSSPNKARKSSAEIERNDSGVGSETSKSSRSRWLHCGPAGSILEDQQHLCEDCDQPVETQVTDSGVMFAPLVCRKCGKKRAERKEIIAEIVETEEKYGRDLQIIMEEFYRPMLVAGLLTPEQLAAIFLNVEELLEHNAALAEKLRDNMEIALEQGDEDLLTVNIGKLFLEASPMLHAFESYCIRQGAASLLLANLEKEKELLRIFLRVSQMENAVLRRMNLNSFLMVPVQRVTKYPLLLARLHKVTPAHHESREHLRQSQHKIELHLEHMNSEAKDISTTKLWRRISIMNGRRSSSETDMLSIKLRKMALDILEWNHDEVRFAMEGKLLFTNPADSNWRKGRTIKLNTINALLVTNGKPTEDYRPDPSEDALTFPRKTGVREATLLLLKEKCGRYAQLREPLYLDKCIVCAESDWEDYFEVQELASKDTFIFKAEDVDRTKLWYRQLQYHAQGMGAWRRRRNALANIMINGMQTRN
ncbi:Myosin-M heavy chain [Zootermopsis nevadensis]|uniref:Myosin-M heavy chain n=2 Tax=Zootermopsis nevadensis TaxID=136037 RepID=A0A067QS88_ZOONE|nr:Myosin-M heavy chain [Zootermopsis nevadensis]